MYLIEFNNANLNPSESIRDYAYRLQKLYSFAYPVEAGKSRDPDGVLQLDAFWSYIRGSEHKSFKKIFN